MTKHSVSLFHFSVRELDSIKGLSPAYWEGKWLLRSGVVSVNSSVHLGPFLRFQDLTHRNILSHSSGGSKNKQKCWQGCFSLMPEAESVPCCSGSFWPSLVFLVLWMHQLNLPSPSHGVLPMSLYVHISPFYRNTSHVGFYNLILT